ncbi:MAG: hypothetical protein OXH31_05945 [Gammaproteobacteria bacterium]|nr:hypothetical protein [Gammaproteobacteria bacterium]
MRKIGRDELRQLLEDALSQAMQGANNEPDNKSRSAKFVECLTNKFRDFYKKGDLIVRVSSRSNPPEFLHDISINQVEVISGPVREVEIDRVVNVLWQIEVELSNDGREVMHDLNKLRAGAVDSDKMFVVRKSWSDTANLTWLTEQVLGIAEHQTGRLFVAFIPHPADWDDAEASVDLLGYPYI